MPLLSCLRDLCKNIYQIPAVQFNLSKVLAPIEILDSKKHLHLCHNLVLSFPHFTGLNYIHSVLITLRNCNFSTELSLLTFILAPEACTSGYHDIWLISEVALKPRQITYKIFFFLVFLAWYSPFVIIFNTDIFSQYNTLTS